jgi:CubicO group peptidase (beta-lactamase class C family)
MQLIEAGKLHLDDRAFDSLSDFAPPNGTQEDPRLRTITIRNLLEHTGGFDSTETDPQFDALRTAADALGKPAPATHTDIIKYMMGQPLAFTPGTKYLYSNLGYNILGRVIERIAGVDYATYIKAHVLAPAGISRMELGRTKPKDRLPDEVVAWGDPNCIPMYSVYEDDLTAVPSSYGGFSMEAIDAHGGWLASTIDLTRFLNAVAGSSGPQLLAPATVQTMLSKPDLSQYRTADHYYAMGWVVGDGIVMNHNGALTWGTSSTIGRLPGGLTYALCFNRLGYDLKTFVGGLMADSANVIKNVTAWPSADLYPQYA